MGKHIANILLVALGLTLMLFTGSRTLDLLGQWLPAGQTAMQWIALASFEGGVLFWSLFFRVGSEGSWQRAIALLMIIFDFISVAIATTIDLLSIGSQDGKLPTLPASTLQMIVIFIGVQIAINVGAFLAAELMSPEQLRQYAIQDSKDIIYTAKLKAIKQQAPIVAQELAPYETQKWVNQVWSEIAGISAPNANNDVVVTAVQNNAPVQTEHKQLAQTAKIQPANDKSILDVFKPLGDIFNKKDKEVVPAVSVRPFHANDTRSTQTINQYQSRRNRRNRRNRKGKK